MLTREQNDLLTQTGPGTPCGKLLRSYWQPIAAAEEMPIGGDPLPITIMSEDLVLFRDDKDRLGLIGRHCAHRGTDLSYGRVENGGLRCLYHGWLFDIHGKCIEMPAEKNAGKTMCDKIKHVGYPVQEKGGAIWAYMGEGEPPLIPDFEFLTAPEPNRLTFRVMQTCNWLQGLESSTDPVHTTFLHRRPPGTASERSGADVAALRGNEVPEVSTEQTGYGTRIFALHNAPNGRKYLRVNNYVFPAGATPSTSYGERGYQGRLYVPIDDYNHFRFEFFYDAKGLDKERLRKNRAANVGPDLRHVRRPENRYLQDREALKRGDTWGGMGMHFPSQDAFAIETQGAIQDRTKEHLGSSDIVITAVRRALFKALEQVQAGNEPPGVIRDRAANPFADFVCTSGYVEEGETGPSFCRRYLSAKAAAAE